MAPFYVFIGGGLGALLRWGVSRWVSLGTLSFPFGVLFCNLLGCFLLGMLAGTWQKPNALQIGVTTGLLGGFTTFSTFSLDTVKLYEAGHLNYAIVYSLSSFIGGVLLAGFGFFIAKHL